MPSLCSSAASEEEMEITLDDLKPREPQPVSWLSPFVIAYNCVSIGNRIFVTAIAELCLWKFWEVKLTID